MLGQEKPQNTRYEPNFNWRGLKRYIGDNQDDSEVFAFLNSDVQYAKYSLILDSVATRLIYFYDNPGIQPLQTNLRTQMPPESGIEVEISMEHHYGPGQIEKEFYTEYAIPTSSKRLKSNTWF